MAIRRSVSFKSVSREIQKKETQLKKLRKGATPQQLKVIDLKLNRLRKFHKSMRPFLLWP
jgi:hypothetical protein